MDIAPQARLLTYGLSLGENALPTLRQLEYLVAVADTRHFGRAAERVHVTQPTLSEQLRALEQRLGGHCQTNLSGSAKGVDMRCSSCQLTPLGQGGRTVLLEDVARVEVTVEAEVIVDRGMGSGKFL